VIAKYIAAYYKEIAVLIKWGQIPDKIGEPLKPIRKRKATSEEVKDVPQKPSKKAKTIEAATSGVQKEVAELDTSEILPKITKGVTTTRASLAQPVKKPEKQPRRPFRKLVMSKYAEEEVIEEEDFSLCLPVFSVNYRLVLIITSETELEISGACCAKVLIEKRVLKRTTRCTQVT